MGVNSKSGIAPEIRKVLSSMSDAICGKLALRLSPATCGSSATAVAAAIAATAAKFNRTVTIELVDAAGNVAEWFNGTLTVGATKSSTSGVIAIEGGGTTAAFKDGKALVTLKYTGTWAEADTATLTVSGSIAGISLTNKTSVDTLIE